MAANGAIAPPDSQDEYEQIIRAIRSGEVDAFVVAGSAGDHVRTLSTTEPLYRRMIDQVQDGAMVLAPDATLMFCNSRFAAMLGIPSDDLTGTELRTRIAPHSRPAFDALLRDAVQGRCSADLRLLAVNGAEFPARVSLEAVQLDQVSMLYGIVVDLKPGEDHARTLETLRRFDRLAALGTMAAGTAHEFNNPLNSILLAAELGLRISAVAEIQQLFSSIREEARRGAQIVRNMLDFGAKRDAERKRMDVNEVVRHAADLCRMSYRTDRLRLETRLCDGAVHACVEAIQIEQVLINLVKNAVEASGETVRVSVETRDDGGRVAIVVADDGPGIPPEILPHIFEPYTTSKRERGGTGLGLSICEAVIEEHGGTIEAASQPGGGAVFTISLPGAD